ncbi:MAG: mitomycin resistance protein [Oligoflexia bacterium]|nr:mitomycin resistance protein [Oligoflexia bacterium]
MKKAKNVKDTIYLEQIPNIGKSIANNLRLIAIKRPKDLYGKDPYKLYCKLCKRTQIRHDPCLLDVFISAVNFIEGHGKKPWWFFTKERKNNFHKIENLLNKYVSKARSKTFGCK